MQIPVLEYNHSQGCSITGGYVYRGSAYPMLFGNYFAGDYCTGIIWSLAPQADGSWTSTQATRLETQISSFGEDFSGELYVLGHATGEIYHIQP
ncbi:MAG: hypothetical protein KC421_18775 [Anaerolineales bacterium]|nr:hypothetical protein [Anaerolineales bacterium]